MEIEKQDNEMLQSAQWRKFQESAGRKTYFIENNGFSASIIEHELPVVGTYLYVPRGPIMEHGTGNMEQKIGMEKVIDLAKAENAGWIRIEPESEEVLKMISENILEKTVKAPHDMQPKEVFVLDITKSEEQLLSEMKSKTRYNISVARKKGVKITSCKKNDMTCMSAQMEFFRLTKEMATRQGISTHPEVYYRKMIESLPSDMLRIYTAEYDGKIISANLVVFYGNVATYLHGASSNEHRNVMAPFLLQWQAITDAKERGCSTYDFGGVKTGIRSQELGSRTNDWAGITNFKLGFSPNTKSVVFLGSYDIIINPRKYGAYRGLQRAKAFLHRMQK